MKQTLLLMMLALGMCSISVSAQTKNNVPIKKGSNSKSSTITITKERQVGDDGYIWYKLKKGNLYGAQDIEGNTIIPIKYTEVFYGCYDFYYKWNTVASYFTVRDGDFLGIYNTIGQCIIPSERHYTGAMVVKIKDEDMYYISVCKNGGFVGLCDMQGNEVIPANYHIGYTESGVPLRVVYITNASQNKQYYIYVTKDGTNYKYNLDGVLIENSLTDVSQNTKFDYSNKSQLYQPSRNTSLSNTFSSNPASSSSSTSNSTSGNATPQTIVVEHHRDPVPVQEWQACFGCGGMGTMGCHSCGGSGTKYIGDRLHRCGLCNGGGIIPCNVCYGNKGKYVTVYH